MYNKILYRLYLGKFLKYNTLKGQTILEAITGDWLPVLGEDTVVGRLNRRSASVFEASDLCLIVVFV